MTELDHQAPQPASTTTTITSSSKPFPKVDILVLGAGWLSQFLLPLLTTTHLTYAATTTTGRNSTIPFIFQPSTPSDPNPDSKPYTLLPPCTTLLITFPLPTPTSPTDLLSAYTATHPSTPHPQIILLGSTGEFQGPGWVDRHTPPSSSPPSVRYQAETHLLSLGGTVLNLAGLFGEPTRDGRIWDRAVPTTREGVLGKKSVHFVHGMDVSRAIVAAHRRFEKVKGERWVVTDGRVYDWWTLVWEEAERLDGRLTREEREVEGGYRGWMFRGMREMGVRALPREGEMLGRRVDGREFWEKVGETPREKGFAWPEEKEGGVGKGQL